MVAKRLHERVVPFKVEMGNMLESLGRSNADQISDLSEKLQTTDSSYKQQDRVVTSLCDKYEVLGSQLQMLLDGGRQATEEQKTSLQKARDNVRAEAVLVLNERLKEEIDALEDRLGKRFEEIEKKTKTVEKRFEASKQETDEQKCQSEALGAKLEDITKLVTELTVSTNKDSKEDISKL